MKFTIEENQAAKEEAVLYIGELSKDIYIRATTPDHKVVYVRLTNQACQQKGEYNDCNYDTTNSREKRRNIPCYLRLQ